MFIGRTFGSYFHVVRSSFSMLWRDFALELPPLNLCGIHTFNIFYSLSSYPTRHACHIVAGITVTASFLPCTIIALHTHRHWLRQLRVSCLLAALHAQLLELCIVIAHLGFVRSSRGFTIAASCGTISVLL